MLLLGSVQASDCIWPQEMFTFWKCMQMVARLRGLVWKQFWCHPGGRVRLSWEACCRASCTGASCWRKYTFGVKPAKQEHHRKWLSEEVRGWLSNTAHSGFLAVLRSLPWQSVNLVPFLTTRNGHAKNGKMEWKGLNFIVKFSALH